MVKGQNISILFYSSLTQLNQNNKISDISSISELKNLKKLFLIMNKIENISALQSLPDLTHLDIQDNKLTSYTLALPNLVELKLVYNKLQDKSGLQYFKNYKDQIWLKQKPNLKQLDISSNNLTEIKYLSNFVVLQFLHIFIINNSQILASQILHQTDRIKYFCNKCC
ncbi:Conserved_hypothetical protein [Hexamita inflata]|uniref:Leucine rich repeat protein n=1 Tax=Hexamita inflata TaxID=28002 RepID=A0AA86QY20_9EUKA|nr:Conserved hypothetical protein [Hexamita inflata]